ncbi:MAG: hypothetical protein JW847_04225 [Candidatus Omnitrophica bacterium]|nr:hypothetical protein [Candidatus Omnitrophota bacterium]
MQIEIFSLCDAATTDGGKLNMLGVFDTIWTKKIPVVHPQCAVAMRIRFFSSEGNKHEVSVKFIDMDGKHIIRPVGGTVRINHPKEQRSTSVNLIFNIQGLKIERYGEYSIDLAVSGRTVSSLPLFVKEDKPKEKS